MTLIVYSKDTAAQEYVVSAQSARFAIGQLWFNVSAEVHDFTACSESVYRQLNWYLNADDVAQRRAAHQIMPDVIKQRIVMVQSLWREMQNLH